MQQLPPDALDALHGHASNSALGMDSAWHHLPATQRPMHVVIKVPWKRPSNFAEPIKVVWTKPMETALWYHLTQQSRHTLDWEAISRQLGVPVPELMRYSTFLYERQIQLLKHQLSQQEQSSRVDPPFDPNGALLPPTPSPGRPQAKSLSISHDSIPSASVSPIPVTVPAPSLEADKDATRRSRNISEPAGSPVAPPGHMPDQLVNISAGQSLSSQASLHKKSILPSPAINLNTESSLLPPPTASKHPNAPPPEWPTSGDHPYQESPLSPALAASAASSLVSVASGSQLTTSLPITASTSLTSPLSQSVSPRRHPPANAIPASDAALGQRPAEVSGIDLLQQGSLDALLREATLSPMETMPALSKSLGSLTTDTPPQRRGKAPAGRYRTVPSFGPHSLHASQSRWTPASSSHLQASASSIAAKGNMAPGTLSVSNEAGPTRETSVESEPLLGASAHLPSTHLDANVATAAHLAPPAKSPSSLSSSLSGYSSFSDLSDSSITESAMVDALISNAGSRMSIFAKTSQLFPWK
ncbi:hypothetical protein H4R35_006331 [Dimargaris xerosporica]|nr:hypothetical protein H4R35_006331 [Dimargaris xerosporica]